MRIGLLFLGLIGLGSMPELQAQTLLSADECAADLAVLDSLVSGSKFLFLNDLSTLESRDALLQAWNECSRGDVGGMTRIEWAEWIHGWLRSANDPHMRVRFDALVDSLTTSEPPPSALLLSEKGPWERLAPGRGIADGARLAWMHKTWPWVGTLHPHAEPENSMLPMKSGVPAESSADCAVQNSFLSGEMAGMEVIDHGAFLRWKISDFASGSLGEFRRAFRKCTRRLRRFQKPVMLDLRGNLGGLRTRRHAVLSFFLAPEYWPLERERPWNAGEGDFEPVPSMPAVRMNRPVDFPVAVLVDGLSFSASLLLTDALLTREKVALFGIEPLGFPGGCSGSPQDHTLPGSGVVVTVPTLYTSVGNRAPDGYGLLDAPTDITGDEGWSDAVRWLLSSDLVSPR